MADRQLFVNNVNAALAAGIGTGDGSFDLDPGLGSLLGTISANEFLKGTIVDDNGTYEHVKVTAVSTDTVTVTRGQEGTSGTAFDIGDNPKLSFRVTKATLERFAQLNAEDTISAEWTFTTNPVFVGGGLTLGTVQEFTSDDTWSRPSGCKAVVVEAVGAGGGGGGIDGDGTNDAAGGGGGSGAGGRTDLVDVTGIATSTLTVPSSGGAGGTAGANDGTTGDDTIWADGTNTFTWGGGTGGVGQTAGASILVGPSSPPGGGTNVVAGGEAGSPNIRSPYNPASTGGSGLYGLGGTLSATGTGVAGTGYGAGGSGAVCTDATSNNRAGGAGAPGWMRVWEYY